MVSLPRPSLLSSSPGLEVLPARGTQQPPVAAPTCFYRFGSSALCHDSEATDAPTLAKSLQRLLQICRLLAVPSLFGQGAGRSWTYSAEHYPTLLQWKQQSVPAVLSEVASLLGQLSTHISSDKHDDDASLDLVIGHVICAVARYLPPTSPSWSGLDSWSISSDPSTDSTWISEAAQSKAHQLLSTLRLQHTGKTSQAAKALLSDYVKPIFREVASSSSSDGQGTIDHETGRKKAPTPGSSFIPHLDASLGRHRFQSAADDNEASNLAPRKFGIHLTHRDALHYAPPQLDQAATAATSSLTERNEALGCTNVLAWCLDNLTLATESEWSEVWPMLVPPLLTLLEHHEPRLRVCGSMLVHTLLLRPSCAGEGQDKDEIRQRETVLGRLLVRTGIGSLLERALHVNLSYIHDSQHGAALVLHSIGSLRQLILITTYPIQYVDLGGEARACAIAADKARLDYADDLGQCRMESIFRLVSEAILSTWSYLPTPPSSTQLGRELISVTCCAWMLLCDDLSPPRGGLGGMMRFVHVTIDWIFHAFIATVSFTHSHHVSLTIQVMRVASRILFSTVGLVSTMTRFESTILGSIAKCYIGSLDSPLRSPSSIASPPWKSLTQCLAEFLTRLSSNYPSIQPHWQQLVAIDSRLAALNPPPS